LGDTASNAGYILLFSENYKRMIKLLNLFKDFIRKSNVQINSKMCQIHKIGRDSNQSFPLTDTFAQETNSHDCTDDTKVIGYFAPLGKGKISKIK
jgi:hypothetical protein